MHPNPLFRNEDRALQDRMLDETGFGMVFLTTPDGPRVAHVPLLRTANGTVQFHLARGNALTRHLDGQDALVVVNGPDAYISPRWYEDRATVPTWDYVALELEGPVRQLDEAGLEAMLRAIGERQEARIADGTPWQADEVPGAYWAKLAGMIVGFELTVQQRRPTFKLSQKRSPAERASIAAAHDRQGAPAIARMMRTLAP